MSVTTLRGPQDLLGNIPSLIGFVPEHSIVVILLRDRAPICTIRFDDDTPDEGIEYTISSVWEQGQPDGLIVVTYGDAPTPMHPLAQQYRHLVRDSLWVAGGVFGSHFCDVTGCCPQPLPDYKRSTLAVLGNDALPSRESLAQSLQWTGDPLPQVTVSHTVRGTEHATVLAALTSDDIRLVTPEVVALLAGLAQHDPSMEPLPLNRRDALMVDLRTGLSPATVGVIARQVPDEDHYTLGLLAMLAWLGGDGASTLILCDRAQDNTLGQLTLTACQSGMHPRDFSESLVGLV